MHTSLFAKALEFSLNACSMDLSWSFLRMVQNSLKLLKCITKKKKIRKETSKALVPPRT